MIRATSAALLLLLLTVTGVVAWLGFAFHKLITDADVAVYNASVAAYNTNESVSTLNDTLASLNAPCKDFQGDYICGPIPQLAQTEKNIGIVAGKSAQQVQQSGTLIDASAKSIQSVADHINKTADAATTGLTAATATINTANYVITNLQAPIDGFTQDAADLDALLKDNAIHRTLEATATTSEQIAGVSTDLRKVTDKATADYLTPKPWYTKMGRFASDAFDYGALAARHIP